jgi:hypothetical protein
MRAPAPGDGRRGETRELEWRREAPMDPNQPHCFLVIPFDDPVVNDVRRLPGTLPPAAYSESVTQVVE